MHSRREDSKLQVPAKEILVKTGLHSSLGSSMFCFYFTLEQGGKDRKKVVIQLSEAGKSCHLPFIRRIVSSGRNTLWNKFNLFFIEVFQNQI